MKLGHKLCGVTKPV